jgi:hypothetical protein
MHRSSKLESTRARAIALLLPALLLAAPTARAAAQRETTDCLAVLDELLTDEPSTDAIRAAAECPSSGPVALANRWTRRGWRDDLERAALVQASSSLKDGRIYDALIGIARSRAYQSEDRSAAIRVLASYYDPRYSATDVSSRSDRAILTARRARVQQIDGIVQPRPTYRREIRETLTRIGDRDRDSAVREEARGAARTLALMEAADTHPVVQAGRPTMRPSAKPIQ